MTLAQRKVGDVVAEDYKLGAIFKRFGIDFCCGGGITVEKACAKKGVDVAELEQALYSASHSRSAAGPGDPRQWKPDFLADYIVNVHHQYVRENIPVLLQFSQKVAKVHGGARPELIEIAKRTMELADELHAHLQKEEEVLFPYVKALVASQQNGETAAKTFDSVEEPIALMEEEHDRAGTLMLEIRELSDDFTPPEWACNTYRALYAKLEEFEEDLHRHVHLENNILFPATRRLDTEAGDLAAA